MRYGIAIVAFLALLAVVAARVMHARASTAVRIARHRVVVAIARHAARERAAVDGLAVIAVRAALAMLAHVTHRTAAFLDEQGLFQLVAISILHNTPNPNLINCFCKLKLVKNITKIIP